MATILNLAMHDEIQRNVPDGIIFEFKDSEGNLIQIITANMPKELAREAFHNHDSYETGWIEITTEQEIDTNQSLDAFTAKTLDPLIALLDVAELEKHYPIKIDLYEDGKFICGHGVGKLLLHDRCKLRPDYLFSDGTLQQFLLKTYPIYASSAIDPEVKRNIPVIKDIFFSSFNSTFEQVHYLIEFSALECLVETYSEIAERKGIIGISSVMGEDKFEEFLKRFDECLPAMIGDGPEKEQIEKMLKKKIREFNRPTFKSKIENMIMHYHLTAPKNLQKMIDLRDLIVHGNYYGKRSKGKPDPNSLDDIFPLKGELDKLVSLLLVKVVSEPI
ncbi:MAG: hypothetical protein SA339_10280 [Methanomassiliicoccus sp.]|nr:hypothetical protein [Methanomassiliicoccus sp.]